MNWKSAPQCPKCKKACFSSEAKAYKRVVNYEDIQRVYYCEHSDSYHITSMSEESALYFGVIDESVHTADVGIEQVKEKLNELKKRL